MAMTTTSQSGSERTRAPSSRRSYRSGGAAFPKVVVVPLCIDELFRTSGTTTFVETVCDLPELAEAGPMIKQVRVHWVCEPATANFSGKVQLQWSALRRVWSDPVDLISAQTGIKAQTIGAWYPTDSSFGLNLQVTIAVANSSGTAVESGRLSAFLEIEFKS